MLTLIIILLQQVGALIMVIQVPLYLMVNLDKNHSNLVREEPQIDQEGVLVMNLIYIMVY